MAFPDYEGGSIVNLMGSAELGLGGRVSLYPPLRGLAPGLVAAHRNLVLLVVDGLGFEYLKAVGAGTWLWEQRPQRLTSVFPSTTAAAVTTFLTADAPQQHALTGWHMYFRELGAVLAVLPGEPRYGGVGLKQAGVDPQALYGHVPWFDRLPVDSFILSPRSISQSDFSLAHRGRAEIRDFGTLGECLAGIRQLVQGPAPGRRCIYAYWPLFDHLSHVHGIGSRTAWQHLQAVDGAIAEFVRRIRGTDTLVLITADHGLVDTDEDSVLHLDGHPELEETLMLPLSGERRAAFAYPWPGRAEAFVRRVEEAFSGRVAVVESRELLRQGAFGLGDPHPRLGERIGVYTLLPRNNSVVVDRVLGESDFAQVGVHGGTSDEEMFVPLIIHSTASPTRLALGNRDSSQTE